MKKRCFSCMQIKTQSPICEHCGCDDTYINLRHQLPTGTMLHKQYIVGKVLGQGGFGITYIGWDTVLETMVAIKEYYPSNYVIRDCKNGLSVFSHSETSEDFFRKSRERFIKEGKILARLRSVHGIARIQRMFEENNTVYIVMEYVRGINLKKYLQTQNRTLSVDETLSLLHPIIDTLCEVHEAGLVHRDISPDNIMIQANGSVKLLDFGSAREVENIGLGKELPQSTEVILKQGFAPVEQYQRRGKLGPWTDIYALCATIYYCLTGTVPSNALDRLVGNDNVAWHQIPGLTPSQIHILERGLDVRPENRVQSTRELRNGLFGQKKGIPEQAHKKASPSGANTSDQAEASQAKKTIHKTVATLSAVLVLIVLITLVKISVRAPASSSESSDVQSTKELNSTDISDEIVQTTIPQQPDPWENNTLIDDFSAYLGEIDKANIVSITFLDSLSDCPDDRWDISSKQDNSVLAWSEEHTGFYDIYIAADGGINAANSCRGLFKDFAQLEEVNFNNSFHTEYTTDMRDMFRRCARITTLNLSHWNTSGTTNMSAMFAGCEQLKTLDLGNWDTSHVTDMSYMFSACKSLKSLNLRHFDTSAVINMCNMFGYCEALAKLDLSGFDTSNVTDMRSMFSDCYNLESLDVSQFDTSRVQDMQYMFCMCQTLSELNLSSFRTDSVSNMSQMFSGCENIVSLDLKNFNFNYVSDLSGMFNHCEQLTFLDLGNFDISRHTNTENMYFACYKLPSKYKHLS